MTMNLRASDFEGDLVAPPAGRPGPRPSARPVKRHGFYRNGAKRACESFLILATAPVWFPLMIVMAILVATDGANPFFAQTRLGKGGREFRIWKLRTMVVDAEARLQAHLDRDPAARAQWDRTQKLKDDPRITRVGRILRKTSLDELPQLLNVLGGSMALVGPRPMMVNQRELYHGRSYYQMRPGITGMWQISARNESEFVARVRYDDAYHRVLSFRTDLGIVLRTVSVVLRGTGY